MSQAAKVTGTQTVPLRTGGRRYAFYLVWITNLGGHQSVSVNELTLYR